MKKLSDLRHQEKVIQQEIQALDRPLLAEGRKYVKTLEDELRELRQKIRDIENEMQNKLFSEEE